MSKSLQEQLLQSGAAKPKQAKKARREKAMSEKQARKQGTSPAEEQALAQQVATAQADKRARDRQLNAELKAQREAREIEHSVAQILSRNKIESDANPADSVDYSYTIDNKIRRIEVSDTQRSDLAEGRLAVVRHREISALVPRQVAERLMEKIPERVWLVSKQDAPAQADDPYAEYKVPDDLVW